MRYKFVLMDADETLLDFKKSEREAFGSTFRKYGIEPDALLFQTYDAINHGLWAAFERGEISKQEILDQRFRRTFQAVKLEGAFEGFEESYQNALSEGSYTIPGALEVCRKLSEVCSLYLVTNGVGFTQRRRMKESGLEPYFKDFFISEEIGFQKPQPEYFQKVFEKIPGFRKEEAVIVGDSLSSDIRGGELAGIDTCWFLRNGFADGNEPQADFEIEDLWELEQIVGSGHGRRGRKKDRQAEA